MTNEHDIAASLKLAISLLEVDRSAYKHGEPDADQIIYSGYTSAITSIGLAAEEIAALKADAERYRWLKSRDVVNPENGPDVSMWENSYATGLRGDDADKAIDSAMNGA